MEITTLSQQEIQQLRKETKGTEKKIHFNNAGSSLPPDLVTETMISYIKEEALSGGYETEDKYKEQLENVYQLIGQLINASGEEIAIVENASAAWSIAFYGIDFREGDIVLTSEYEYVTNLIGLLNVQKTKGIVIKVIPNDEQGNFSIAALEAAISPKVRLIAVTHIPSSAGGMLPIVEIGAIARQYKILYLLDACQSIGQVPIDVKEINCDMLSVTGRKYLRAPRGTGFLYVRKEIQDQLKPVFMDGSSIQWVSEEGFKIKSNATRFELYENNRALRLGLGVAVQYALGIGMERIWHRVRLMAGLLRDQLRKMEGITVHDRGDHQCGIVTFSVKGMDSNSIKEQLAAQNINVSIGKTRSTLYYMNKNHLENVVRASVHYYNTEEEIKTFCEALTTLSK